MATPRPKRKYSCSQTELYQICHTGWQSYLDNVAAFTAFNANYDAAYGAAAIAEIDAAQALPDFQQRDYVSESLRIQLVQQADAAIILWKTLRSHIAKAFPAPNFETSMEAAGIQYYDDAVRYDWEELKQMLLSGQAFITANTAALSAIGMTVAFPTDYQNAYTQFNTTLTNFLAAEQEGKQGTDEKIIANNNIFDKLNMMFDDGQIIFINDAATRERFMYSKVRQLISNQPGNDDEENQLTFSGYLTDNENNEPIVDAVFTVGTVTFTTDEDGYFEQNFTITEVTTFNATIKKPGYETATGPIQMSPGVNLTQDLQMTPTGYLFGVVTNFATTFPLGGVIVTDVASGISTTSDANGNYILEGISEGNRDISYAYAGFQTTVVNRNFVKRIPVEQNVSLQPNA